MFRTSGSLVTVQTCRTVSGLFYIKGKQKNDNVSMKRPIQSGKFELAQVACCAEHLRQFPIAIGRTDDFLDLDEAPQHADLYQTKKAHKM